MSEETGKDVKRGLKKGASIVGKIIKWFFIIVAIIIAICIGYSIYTCTVVSKAVVDVTKSVTGTAAGSNIVKDAIRDATGGEDREKMAAEAISVSAVDLYSAYDSNAVKADNTYKGKTVRVTGKVSKVDKDLFGNAYVMLNCAADNPYMDYVHIYFKESEMSKVADLDNGKIIKIVGKCEGQRIVSVDIKDSFFE